jgi:transcriptional regulator with XRE-family HTH domain
MTEATERRPDLSRFYQANAEAKKKGGKKLSWDKRVKLVESQFPNVLTLDWKRAFDKDLSLFAWIMQDILKADGGTAGRSGPKPAVDRKSGMVRLRQLMGEDYSTVDFPEAFAGLSGGNSLTVIARKTGIARTQVFRLLHGEVRPTSDEMERIAKSYNRSPGYFCEYRRGLLLAALADKLDRYPESTVKYWRELTLAEVS